jgi:exonuclease VII large subunit
MLALLDPFAVLARGYAALSNPATGAAIVSTAQVEAGTALAIALRDGQIDATALHVNPQGPSA